MYEGTVALGDVLYKDGFDRWEDIKGVFKEPIRVPLVPNHKSTDVIGVATKFKLSEKDKKLNVQIDDSDLKVRLDVLNSVSPQWIVNSNGKIVGINHIAVGNTFNPLCSKNECFIVSRGEENKMSQVEILQKEIADLKLNELKLEKENLTLKNKYVEAENLGIKSALEVPEKKKEEPKEPDKKEEPKLDLSKKKDIEQDIDVKAPKIGVYSKDWESDYNLVENTKYVLSGKK